MTLGLTAISNDEPDVTDAGLARIAALTLVVCQERDVIHPIAYVCALADTIPSARFMQITPRAESRTNHVGDFRRAMSTFPKELR